MRCLKDLAEIADEVGAYLMVDMAHIAGLVAAGFGIAVVPYMDMLKRLDVKVLSIKHQPVDRLYYVVHDSRTYMSPVATKFHKYVLSSN